MTNKAVRTAMIEANLHQWELARLLEIHESTLCRMMRDELPAEKQEEIISVIHEHMKGEGK